MGEQYLVNALESHWNKMQLWRSEHGELVGLKIRKKRARRVRNDDREQIDMGAIGRSSEMDAGNDEESDLQRLERANGRQESIR